MPAKEFEIYYGNLPFPVLVMSENGGKRTIDYRNRAAAALAGQNEAELIDIFADYSPQPENGGRCRFSFAGIEFSARICPMDDGRLLVIMRDLTEDLKFQQKQIDDARAALQSALDAANSANRAKTDFLSNMSHDIRTPLNAIIGMTTIASEYINDIDRVRECISKIELSSRHLLSIINDILDMSRIESGKMTVKPENFMMADFIHSLIVVISPQAEAKRQKIELDFSGLRHEYVCGDSVRIQQVLVNILSNAVKFTPAEGSITLSVREGEKKGAYSYYEFTVKDTGIGMDKEFLKKIFLPFERDTAAHHIEGTGLGMAITLNLVKMMNGEISVESEKGKGTEFKVVLPLERLEDDNSKFSALRGLKVLAAESDEQSLKNLKQKLKELGVECDGVCGKDAHWRIKDMAADAAAEQGDCFAILLGWKLPTVDGVQVCSELRKMISDPKMPIILMSTYDWTMSADEMNKKGISAFLPKPVFKSRLGDVLYSFTDEAKAKMSSEIKKAESFDGTRILLVEDNEINREIGMELLNMLGAEVECAEDGRKAVEKFESAAAGYYDLIFMDIQMPNMNGYEATERIRNSGRADAATVPIVAMSANAFIEDKEKSKQAGMNGHISKPVSRDALIDALKEYLTQK